MSAIWMQSSRVGTMMSAWVPSPLLTRGCCACRSFTIGARYASVLPDPVGAFTSASLPLYNRGNTPSQSHACCCLNSYSPLMITEGCVCLCNLMVRLLCDREMKYSYSSACVLKVHQSLGYLTRSRGIAACCILVGVTKLISAARRTHLAACMCRHDCKACKL